VKLDLKAGKLISYADPRWLTHPVVVWIPRGVTFKKILLRSLTLTFVFMVIFDPITLLAFYGSDVRKNGMLVLWDFVLFKGYWGAIFGALVTPFNAFIVICATNTPPVKRESVLSIIDNTNAINPQIENPDFIGDIQNANGIDELERSPLTSPKVERED